MFLQYFQNISILSKGTNSRPHEQSNMIQELLLQVITIQEDSGILTHNMKLPWRRKHGGLHLGERNPIDLVVPPHLNIYFFPTALIM